MGASSSSPATPPRTVLALTTLVTVVQAGYVAETYPMSHSASQPVHAWAQSGLLGRPQKLCRSIVETQANGSDGGGEGEGEGPACR